MNLTYSGCYVAHSNVFSLPHVRDLFSFCGTPFGSVLVVKIPFLGDECRYAAVEQKQAAVVVLSHYMTHAYSISNCIDGDGNVALRSRFWGEH